MADLYLSALRAKAEDVKSLPSFGASMTINGELWFDVVLALVARVEKAEALITKAGKNAPVYKSVEKILDEHSAWIARPDRKVTAAVALAAVTAADLEAGASHVLGALHERCDAAEAENAHLRALLTRAGEALKPFAATAEVDIGGDETDLDRFRPMTAHAIAPAILVGDICAARTIAREIEETLKND